MNDELDAKIQRRTGGMTFPPRGGETVERINDSKSQPIAMVTVGNQGSRFIYSQKWLLR